MQKLYEFQKIYDALLNYDKVFRRSGTIKVHPFHDILLGVSVVCFIAAILMALSTHFIEQWKAFIIIIIYILVIVAQLSVMASQLVFILSVAFSFRQPIKGFFEPLARDDIKDLEFALSLHKFSKNSLLSVKHKLEYEKETMYSRIGILVGAIDKVGIASSIFVLGGAFLKIQKTPPEFIEPFYVDIAIFVIVALYIFGVLCIGLIHKITKFCMLIQIAIENYSESPRTKN